MIRTLAGGAFTWPLGLPLPDGLGCQAGDRPNIRSGAGACPRET